MPSRQDWIWSLYSRPNESLLAQHIMSGGKTSCSSTIKICSQGSKDAVVSTQSCDKMGPRSKCLVLLKAIESRLGFFSVCFPFRHESCISMVSFKQISAVSNMVLNWCFCFEDYFQELHGTCLKCSYACLHIIQWHETQPKSSFA